MEKKRTWYLNDGANNHMRGDRSNFVKHGTTMTSNHGLVTIQKWRFK